MRLPSISQLPATIACVVIALLYLQPAPMAAQKVRLSLTVSGRPSPYLADWAAHKETAVLTVNNTSGGTVEGRLHAKVLLDDALRAETRTDLMPVVAFPPGVSTYFADQFLPHDAVRFFGGVEKTATKTGMLPAGSYQLCVELLGAMEPKPLSEAACKQFLLTDYKLPDLLQPANASRIKTPQGTIFRWTPVLPAPPGGARYRLKIFELLQGQTPASAVRSSHPVYETEIASQTQLIWPPDLVLSPSVKRFAWSIQSVDAEGRTLGEPDGWSEPFTFELTESADIVKPAATKDGKSVKIVDAGSAKTKLGLFPASITGQLVWAFRTSEYPVSATQQGNGVHAPYATAPSAVNAAAENPGGKPKASAHHGGSGTEYPLLSNIEKKTAAGKSAAVVLSGEGEVASVLLSESALAGGKKSSPYPDLSTHPYAPELEKYAAPTRYPLQGVTVNLYIRYKLFGNIPGNSNNPTMTALVGSGQTDPNGYFSIDFINEGSDSDPVIAIGSHKRSVSMVYLEVDEKHFVFEPSPIPVVPDSVKHGTFRMGTIVNLAQSYRLHCKGKEFGSGKEIPNVRTEVFRNPLYYMTMPNLLPEGNEKEEPRPLELKKFGKPHVRVGGAASTASVPRLFSNAGGANDMYRLRLTAPGYDTVYASCSAIMFDDAQMQVPTVTRTFTFVLAPSLVEGRVIDKETKAAHGGITITLANPSNGKSYSVETDADGRFIITNIALSQTPYSLTVNGNGVSGVYTESILVDLGGMVITRDPLEVDLIRYPVTGTLVDDRGKPVPSATVRWKTGSDPIYTAADGSFSLENVSGKSVLQFRKPGYLDKDTTVNVRTPGKEVIGGATPNSSKVIIVKGGAKLGAIIMQRDVGRILVTVKDKGTSKPLPGAVVIAGEDAALAVSGANGAAFLTDAPTGTVTLRVFGATSPLFLEPGSVAADVAKILLPNGPSSSGIDYVPYTATVTVAGEGDTSKVTILLQQGGRVSGTVSASTGPVQDATIRVDGFDEPVARSGTNGSYAIIGVPLGSQKLRASKTGFLADEKSTTISSAPATLNFILGESGFDISTLLGFPIEVKTLTLSPDTIITGAFVNIPGNAVFTCKAGETLPFTAAVTRIGGKLRPKGGSVVTNQPELKGKAYAFLPVSLKASAGIEVKATADGFGLMTGRIAVNLGDVISPASGIAPPANADLFLVSPDKVASGKADGMPMFSSAAMPYPADSLVFMASSAYALTAFGFAAELSPSSSSLRADGFHLRGKLTIPNHPLLGTTSIALKELRIDKTGLFQLAALGFDPAPSVSLASWKLTFTGGSLSQNGLQVNGNLLMTLTQSSPSTVDFSGLNISADQVFGGQFTIPSSGIDLMGITTFKGGSVPFGLGNSGPGNILYLSGSGGFPLPKLSKNVAFDEFRVQSNGLFNAKATPNFHADFDGLISLTLTSIEFNTIAPVGITLDGAFGLKIGFVNVAAGGHIKFVKNGPPQIQKLHIGFDIPAAKIDVNISYLNSIFSGSGSIKIPDTPIDFGVNFTYGKDTVMSSFVAAIPPIMLGPYFVLDKIGGGFSYGAKSGKFSIWIDGGLSVTGTSVALSAYPIRVTVESGPVIIGEATLNVFQIPVGKTTITMDFPEKLFSFVITSDVEFLPSVKSTLQGILALRLKQDDSYFLLACNANSRLLGLFETDANFAAGWNVNLSKHPEYSTYVSFVPASMLSNGNTVNGVHINAYTEVGATANGDIGIASGSIWYKNTSWTVVNFNFAMGSYGLTIGNSWGGGGDLSVSGLGSVGGLGVTASGALSGAYNSTDGWYFCGVVGGQVAGYIGGCSSACANKICWCDGPNLCWPWEDCSIPYPCGAKLCVGVNIHVKYRSTSGFSSCVGWPGHSCSLCN